MYDQELNEILSYLHGIWELNRMHQKCPVPASLVNPEVILPQKEFKATIVDRKGWMDESWSCSGEVPQKYVLDGCEAWVDWAIDEKDLTRPRDTLDDADCLTSSL